MNVHFDGVREKGLVFLDDDQAQGLANVEVNPADVLLNITGASIGRVALAPDWVAGARVNQHVAIIRTVQGLDPRFVARFLAAPAQQRFISGANYGVTRPALTKQQILDFELPLPPLNEQRRIVDKIDALFAHSKKAKESLDRIPALLEKLKKSILAAAFRGDLTKDWREAHPDVEPADKLLERIRVERRRRWEEAELAKMRAKGKEPSNDKWKEKYEEPRGIDTIGLPPVPETWLWVPLGEIVEPVRNGVSPKPFDAPPGVPILRISSVRPLEVDLSSRRYLREEMDLSNFGLRNGDLLFTRYNGTLSLVGVCGVVRGLSEAMTYPDKLIRAKAVEVLPEYVELAAASTVPRSFIEDKAKTTSGQQGISGGDLCDTPIPLPPLAEQRIIVAEVQGALSRVKAASRGVRHAETNLRRLTQTILAKAFRGELVPQNPDDEPATLLLKRIRAEREASVATGTTPEERQTRIVKSNGRAAKKGAKARPRTLDERSRRKRHARPTS